MPSINSIRKTYQAIPSLDLFLLLEKVTRKDRAWLMAHSEYALVFFAFINFLYLYWQRKKGVPLAHLTHHKEFWGIDFFVNKHTLVPRPETELLVEEVLKELGLSNNTGEGASPLLIDVGTGSGCIPIAILKNISVRGGSAFGGKTFAIDISRSALRIAKKNARIQNVFIEFHKGNLLEPLIHNNKILNQKSKIIITANLPYLTAEQFAGELSIQREPRRALVADTGGLALYEELLEQIKTHLIPQTKSLAIFFEIDPGQSDKISKMIVRILPHAQVEIKKDLAGLLRVVRITFSYN